MWIRACVQDGMRSFYCLRQWVPAVLRGMEANGFAVYPRRGHANVGARSWFCVDNLVTKRLPYGSLGEQAAQNSTGTDNRAITSQLLCTCDLVACPASRSFEVRFARQCSSGGLMAGRLYRLGVTLSNKRPAHLELGAGSDEQHNAVGDLGQWPNSMPVVFTPGQAAKPLGAIGDNNRIIRFSCLATRQLLSERGGRPGGRSLS